MFSKFFDCVMSITVVFFLNCNGTTNYDKLINEFVVQIPGGYSTAKGIATQMGFLLHHKMMGFDDLFVFKFKKKSNDVNKFFQHRIKRSSKVNFIEQQIVRKRVKRAAPSMFIDPLYESQWYLMRSTKSPKEADMNVIEAWQLGYTGKGVVVCILDDGIDYRHPDLKDNYDPKASYDINGGDNDPLANYNIADNRHGTRCAGEVSAKANNSQCGVGIAFNSKIGAVRMLDGEVTDRVEAEALSFRQQYIDIYSGSWGPDDNGERVEGPARLAKAAFEKGIKSGRNGLGNIYIWASGNGGHRDDSCACDGYASSIYTLSVSSVSELNLRPWYLESCASTLISTYSSGGINENKITSTDLNFQCTTDHSGTSASAPLAAGIVALLLEANGNLTWRDVQYITVVTANTDPFTDANFIINGANRKVSNLYGFGLMNTGKMVRLGKLWQTLPSQHVCNSVSKAINRHVSGVFVEREIIEIDGCSGNSIVNYIEHVILYLTIQYHIRGDLQVHLISPTGTRSEILPYRKFDFHSGSATFDKWPLMTVQFWGERPAGKWILEIRNKEGSQSTVKGFLQSFSLEIYGTDKWPMRLRAPVKRDADNWFQQFERYVVNDGDESVGVHSTHSRGRADTSNGAFKRAQIQCHDQCFNNTCNGFGPQHCILCKKYKTYNGACVEQCPAGTYLNNMKLICELCHFSCDECMGAGKYNCSRCHVGDSFVGARNQCNISVKGCPEDFYKDTSTCVKCPSYCSVCHSNTQCSQCKNGFLLTLNSQCKQFCDLGSYPDTRGRCRVCHIDCLSCVGGNMNECTGCRHGTHFLSVYSDNRYGRCISECTPGYYTNRASGLCTRCHPNCKTCIGPSADSCTDCIPPLELSDTGNTCIDPVSYNCKPNEFKTATERCDICPTKCGTCIDGICTSCVPYRRFLLNGSCSELCPEGYFSISSDNVCLPCRSFCDDCDKHSSLTECSQCISIAKPCNRSCNTGEYLDNKTKSCSKCHLTCSSCIGGAKEDCIKCSHSDYYKSSRGCIKRCPPREHTYITKTHKLCIPCHSSCQNSSCDSETGKCINCPTGHRLSPDGRCDRIITCPMTYYWQANESMCKFCHQSCRSCYVYGPCTSCATDHCLLPSFGTCHPCCSQSNAIKNCFKCLTGREFCQELDSMLLSSQLLIFRLPVSVLITLMISIIILFILIIVWFYRESILAMIKLRWSRQPSMRYTKLKHNIEHDGYDGSSSDELSENDSVIFHNVNKPLLLVPIDSTLVQTNLTNEI